MIAWGFKPHGHLVDRLHDLCWKSFDLVYARQLFDEITDPEAVVRTTLIAAYSALGIRIWQEKYSMPRPLNMRNTIISNAVITGYVGQSALEMFHAMRRGNFRPHDFKYTNVLSALAFIVDIDN